jgi:hypothetical protein
MGPGRTIFGLEVSFESVLDKKTVIVDVVVVI